jgi:acetylornithine deacetylase/succinyl-diaminopimelate desuccinylase-like protein
MSTEGPSTDLLELSEGFWENAALEVLSDYVRIPCLSPDFDPDWESRGDITRAAELLKEWAAVRTIEGIKVRTVSMPGLTPLIVAHVPASGGLEDAAPTLLYGHLDKQPPLGSWREGLGPFAPVREDDCLFGRGTADDGYSIFAALGAIEIAQRAGLAHGRCVVIIEASEESGSPHLVAYLSQLGEDLGETGPGLIMCLDSGAATYDRLWTTTSLRGLISASVSVEVLTEGVHSGTAGGLVPDSFRLLRQLLDRIEEASTGRVLLQSCETTIAKVRRREAAVLAASLGSDAIERFPLVKQTASGNSSPNHESVAQQLLTRCWSPSIAYVGMDGMPAVADAGNVLRPLTRLKLVLRIPPNADSQAVAVELTERLGANPPPSSVVTVADVVSATGFDAPQTADWLATAIDQASATYFGAKASAMGHGGTIPFLNLLARNYPDAQFLVTGVLGPESNAHGPNEMLHIPTAKRITASLAHVLTKVPAT